jgi:hypothetical protein
MNNTTNLAMAAIFIAAILVIAGTFAATMSTTTQSTAFAYQQNKKGVDKRDGNGNNNGNTITIQKCKQAATQSGFDNSQGQECQNLICTHPGENATCIEEGVRSISTPTPTPTPEPTTTTLRVIKKVVCQPTDPNCFPAPCQIFVVATSNQPSFTCQSAAIENGVLVTLQPGDDFSLEEAHPGSFDATFEGDCLGPIAAGQHLTCTITNTELRDT